MSYYIGMYFKKVKSLDDAVNIANMFMKECCTEDNLKLLVNNCFSRLISILYRENINITEKSFYKHYEFYSRLFQLLLTYNFLYFPKHKLLGLCYVPSKQADSIFDCRIEFQNYCDQNYDYEEWIPLGKFFKDKVKEFKTMPKEELIKYCKHYTLEDLENCDLDYYRKSAMYIFVYKELDLDNWLWTKQSPNNSFIPLNMYVPCIYDNCQIIDHLKKYLLEAYKNF